MYIVTSVVILLIAGAVSLRMFVSHCTENSGCPSNSMCVYGKCIDCKCEPLACMTNVEICKGLNCGEGQACYLSQDVDYETGIGTARPICANINPCPSPLCSDCAQCIPMNCGFLPPYEVCAPKSYQDPCDDVYCPDNYTCQHNYATCYGVPCNTEAACINTEDCNQCKYNQICDFVKECDYTYKGICTNGK